MPTETCGCSPTWPRNSSPPPPSEISRGSTSLSTSICSLLRCASRGAVESREAEMECTVYNPQKGRLETLEVEFTQENTTWFYSRTSGSVTLIADWEGGLLIKAGYDYPIYLYDISREDIGYSKRKARELIRQYQ